jgi:CBS domain-containing protein
VTDSAGGVAGILSERDIVRALAERGAAALDGRLDQVMTCSIVTCTEAMTVSEIMKWMTAGRFRHVPVVELGRSSASSRSATSSNIGGGFMARAGFFDSRGRPSAPWKPPGSLAAGALLWLPKL